MATRFEFFLILICFVLCNLSCGVKGPPLPPLPTTPQQSEIRPNIRASGTPSPISSYEPTFNRPSTK